MPRCCCVVHELLHRCLTEGLSGMQFAVLRRGFVQCKRILVFLCCEHLRFPCEHVIMDSTIATFTTTIILVYVQFYIYLPGEGNCSPPFLWVGIL